jgi:glycosyltransferase involved in cell wall biosynthesis
MSPGNSISESKGDEIAMLLNGDEVYGIGTILKLYAIGLPNISFVAPGDGPMVDWLKANGNRVDVVPGLVNFPEGGASLLTLAKMPGVLQEARRTAARFVELLSTRDTRIVHAHWRAQQITAGFMRKRGYQSVWQINNTMNRRRLLTMGVRLNHRLAKWGADLLLPASDAIGVNWQGCGVPSITVRNAAVPIFKQPNTLPETPIRCLVAGRLDPSKGHHLAVEAVLHAREAGHDVRLDIYGGPLENNAYADSLRHRIVAAGCSDSIQLLGFRSDLRDHHQDYHLGMQCRVDVEPCSLWVCETLVDGLPLVASATGGTPELVEDGVTGLLYCGGDLADLTDKLMTLVRDPVRLREMRSAAFARGNAHFSLDTFIRQTLDAYATLPQLAEVRR